MSNSYGIYFGAPDEQSIAATSKGILDILSAPHADEATKQIALKVLAKGVQSPSGNMVTNCHLVTQPSPEPVEDED